MKKIQVSQETGDRLWSLKKKQNETYDATIVKLLEGQVSRCPSCGSRIDVCAKCKVRSAALLDLGGLRLCHDCAQKIYLDLTQRSITRTVEDIRGELASEFFCDGHQDRVTGERVISLKIEPYGIGRFRLFRLTLCPACAQSKPMPMIKIGRTMLADERVTPMLEMLTSYEKDGLFEARKGLPYLFRKEAATVERRQHRHICILKDIAFGSGWRPEQLTYDEWCITCHKLIRTYVDGSGTHRHRELRRSHMVCRAYRLGDALAERLTRSPDAYALDVSENMVKPSE